MFAVWLSYLCSTCIFSFTLYPCSVYSSCLHKLHVTEMKGDLNNLSTRSRRVLDKQVFCVLISISHYFQHLLFRSLGLNLALADPPENDHLQILNEAWKVITKLKNPQVSYWQFSSMLILCSWQNCSCCSAGCIFCMAWFTFPRHLLLPKVQYLIVYLYNPSDLFLPTYKVQFWSLSLEPDL